MSISQYLRRGMRYLLKGTPLLSVTAEVKYLSPSKRLEGRKILLTGGGRGLGRDMAEKFISEGAQVVITGRNESQLRETSEKIGCHYIVWDLIESQNYSNLITKASEVMGSVDTLVNNAGISLHEGWFLNVSPDDFDSQFATNLRAPYFLTQAFVKYLEKESPNVELEVDFRTTSRHETREIRGNVLFISSERGATADDLPYGLTKVALNSLTKGLAARLQERMIRVNAVAPGVTASDMSGFSENGNLQCTFNPSGRVYLPGEVSEVATFMLSEESGCLNGQILYCNSGKSNFVHFR